LVNTYKENIFINNQRRSATIFRDEKSGGLFYQIVGILSLLCIVPIDMKPKIEKIKCIDWLAILSPKFYPALIMAACDRNMVSYSKNYTWRTKL